MGKIEQALIENLTAKIDKRFNISYFNKLKFK